MSKSLIGIFLLIGILGIGLFILWPRYQEAKAFQEKVSERQTELAYREQYVISLDEAEKSLERYKEEFSKVNSAIAAKPDVPSMFNFLERSSFQNGLIIKNLGSFSLSPVLGKEKLNAIVLNFSTSGSYSSLKNFLHTLEKSSRLIDVETVSLASESVKEEPGVAKESLYSLSFRIKVYSY